MVKIIFALIVCAACAFDLFAQTDSAPVRLAIIRESPEVAVAADLLAAELSKHGKVALLERGEIEKIYREQALSAATQDYLKLGQVLGADGLLFLRMEQSSTNRLLGIELVAVKPGVLLLGEKSGFTENPVEWAAMMARHLEPLFPKLGVLAKEAIPISIVNFRSAIQSAESRETERQLTLLAIERLSRERQLFVLERRRMQKLSGEKELKGLDDSPFWNGSYLLDGIVDNNGYSQDIVTINARLVPPQGGLPVLIEASGRRTNFVEVINQFAARVLEKLQPGRSVATWKAADEAGQFYSEAQWALKWQLYPQAQTAAETAWALGRHNIETASLLVRTYAESMPEYGMNQDIPVRQIPDASQFAPLDRGLDFFSQNAAELFNGTNALPSFKLGLRLLWPATGLLESYYYAAEERDDHAEELTGLREKVRQTFSAMDAHLLVVTNILRAWEDPRLRYAKLKWEEAGMAFDHPAEAVRFYRDCINAVAHPENLPRIIGWSWPDRQRVPGLLRHWVEDVCADTNAVVRLEGLYFTLLLAPDDEQGSLRRSEEALESAMWENRKVLFCCPENASLVERTRRALCAKENYNDISHAFVHEPFASLKHRLRMDFLTGAANTNFAVLDALFPNTSVVMETPEQARELLPLLEAARPKFPPTYVNLKLASLKQSAGIVQTVHPDKPKPSVSAAATVAAKFIPWNLSRSGIDADRQPKFREMIFRNDKLWVHACYVHTNDSWDTDSQSSYLIVDPHLGVQEEILFPAQLGSPGDLFEVSSNALFVEARGRLFEFKFSARDWEEIPVPMEGASKLVWLKDHLYVGRNDGLLAVEPDSKQVQLLVSARRTPPANAIDPLWTSDMQIYAQMDGRLGGLSKDSSFAYEPKTGHWINRPQPLAKYNKDYRTSRDYISAGGAQRLIDGLYTRHYLIGFENDDEAPKSLMFEEANIPGLPFPMEKLMAPVRWDWPRGFPLEDSQITSDGTNLWMLAPRKTGPSFMLKETVQFSDDRQATLFCFAPDSRQPLLAAIHLPTNALGEMPRINGRPLDILEPEMFDPTGIYSYPWVRRFGNYAFWLRTPDGLVLGGPNYCGHWLITDQMLKAQFEAQRAVLRPPASAAVSSPTKPQKP